ncbi:hypothetical protein LCGC14_1040770 [marine sediment metagenome]|uniref:Uncharacterized protein n=1 Tax=marine sediment metagenome TaxID=412755 RepID=A0A0F9NDG1_9ZZZZ
MFLLEKHFGGHLTVGRFTIYGENAMHWGVNIYTKRWGYVCFRLPLRCFGKWWPLYFYLSPNATPWASTYYRGSHSQGERARARQRRAAFGHNFSVDDNYDALKQINGIE